MSGTGTETGCRDSSLAGFQQGSHKHVRASVIRSLVEVTTGFTNVLVSFTAGSDKGMSA